MRMVIIIILRKKACEHIVNELISDVTVTPLHICFVFAV